MKKLSEHLPGPKHKHEYKSTAKEESRDSTAVSTLPPASPKDTKHPKRAMVTSTLTATLPGTNTPDYTAIARQGQSHPIQCTLADMLPFTPTPTQLTLPTPSQIERETAEAQRKIARILAEKGSRVGSNALLSPQDADSKSKIITINDRQANDSDGGGSDPKDTKKKRIVQITQKAADPLDPPRFHHKRVPRAPPSPPPPLLHSPPRPISSHLQSAWKIPPCISSWKNPKGYTVPLDKRLAFNDPAFRGGKVGRRAGEMAEALHAVEQLCREQVEARADELRARREKEVARIESEQRLAASQALAHQRAIERQLLDDAQAAQRHEHRHHKRPAASDLPQGVRERERLRAQMDHERKRDLRLARVRLEDRDQSEKIALGLPSTNANTNTNAESQVFDQRLFGRDGGGVGSGLLADDAYNLYDRPLFGSANSEHLIYRPSFAAAAAEGEGSEGGQPRVKSGPVHYEREQSHHINSSSSNDNKARPKAGEDPFEIDQFLAQARTHKPKPTK